MDPMKEGISENMSWRVEKMSYGSLAQYSLVGGASGIYIGWTKSHNSEGLNGLKVATFNVLKGSTNVVQRFQTSLE